MSYKGYKVHITKDGETSAPSEKVYNQNGGTQAQSTTKAGTVEASGRKKAINIGMVYLGKQALNYGLSNYGSLTGDYLGQEKISAGIEMLGLVTLATTGWAGVLAAGTSIGIKTLTRGIDISKSRVASNIQMERLGLTQGGSRL